MSGATRNAPRREASTGDDLVAGSQIVPRPAPDEGPGRGGGPGHGLWPLDDDHVPQPHPLARIHPPGILRSPSIRRCLRSPQTRAQQPRRPRLLDPRRCGRPGGHLRSGHPRPARARRTRQRPDPFPAGLRTAQSQSLVPAGGTLAPAWRPGRNPGRRSLRRRQRTAPGRFPDVALERSTPDPAHRRHCPLARVHL